MKYSVLDHQQDKGVSSHPPRQARCGHPMLQLMC